MHRNIIIGLEENLKVYFGLEENPKVYLSLFFFSSAVYTTKTKKFNKTQCESNSVQHVFEMNPDFLIMVVFMVLIQHILSQVFLLEHLYHGA